jgi:hypothetical protein
VSFARRVWHRRAIEPEFLSSGDQDINVDMPFLDSTSASGNRRADFDVRAFANKYNLGNPIGMNYFKALYDDFSDKIYERPERRVRREL